jgi:predicted DNA binding CopG/RHH family protein
MATHEKTVTELHAEIRKLTGRSPLSRNLEYLMARLADLIAAKRSGEDVRKHYAEPQSILNTSMPARQHAAVKKMAADDGLNVSELVRLALADYAKKHGHKKALEAFATAKA